MYSSVENFPHKSSLFGWETMMPQPIIVRAWVALRPSEHTL
ncbi:hypothetical protein CASFOL_017425 [Castilleja foliolosa]|uniref:Uncharacterized protein n=1 Tax=Castilleja foliolosa TaxID=1961234 RepID=A0ABD3DBI3_9LAMI